MIRFKVNVPWWLFLIFFGAWLLVFCFLSGSWRYFYTAEGWKTITHDQYHFSVEYPAKWATIVHGESGHRGVDEIKLYIYRTYLENFSIRVYQIDAENPSIEEVADWGENRINRINRNEERAAFILREIKFSDYMIDENKALVRRYGNEGRIYEDVYIARPNDMIIIQLYTEADDYDRYIGDFYRIVDSFRTIE
jgi:hypothetical protein